MQPDELTARAGHSGSSDTIVVGLAALAALARATNALPRGTARVRAAAAVVDAYARIDVAHAARATRLGASPGWTSLGLGCLKRAVDALAPRAVMAPFDSGDELVRAAATRATTLIARATGGPTSHATERLEDRRFWLLADGAALRDRLAVLHRVATEVATRFDAAPALAALAPAPLRPDAERITATGCVVDQRGARFIGDVDEPRFPASLPRAIALAEAGDVEGLRRCVAALAARDRATARPLDALALVVSGDVPASRHALRRLGRGDRDRALVRITARELARGRTDLAEGFASDIASAPLQHGALADTLEAELGAGVIRRELVRRVSSRAAPLDAALLATELAVIHHRDDEAYEHLARVGELLASASRAATSLGHEPPRSWERAIRAATALALRGHRPPSTLLLTRATVRPVARRARLLALLWPVLESLDCPSEEALERLPASLVAVRDALAAERIRRAAASCRVADALAALDDHTVGALGMPATASDAALAGAIGVRARVSSDPGDPARAAYDFGVALSPRLAARRTILLHACERALQIDGLSGEALRWRESCLRQLDGDALANALLGILETRPLSEGWVGTAITLAGRAQPKRVIACAFRRFDEMTGGGRRLQPILDALTKDAGLTPRFAQCLRALAASSTPATFARWWQDFSATWADRTGRAVHEAAAALLVEAPNAGLLRMDGASAMAFVEHAVEQAIRSNQLLAADAAPTLAWAAALHDPQKDAPWSEAVWRARITSARQAGTPHLQTVARLVSALGVIHPEASLARRLVNGSAPTAELADPAPIGNMVLRYLDKRRDLFAFLRVCDATPCCFSSDSPYFDRNMHTSRWVDRLWRDPLSFAYALDAPSGPAGFVFGGYGLVPGPALLLNGVYLRRQSAGVRSDVLAAIERRHATPLGIRLVGVATLHGGAGDMPPGYVQGAREGTRLRALENQGELETKIYDDISSSVNEPTTFRLHWRHL